MPGLIDLAGLDDAALAAITAGGGLTRTAVKTGAYTASPGDLVPVDTTAGNVTVTLPAAPADKAKVTVKHIIQGGANTVTVACGGSDVLNKAGGNTTATLTLVNQGATYEYQASTHIWTVTAGDLPLTGLNGTYAKVFTPEAYGAKGDGTTDDTAAINAAIAAAATAGGGTVRLSSKTYLCTGAVTFPNAGASTYAQAPLHITSDSIGKFNGFWAATLPTTGAVLDLRYDGTDTIHPAKIDTRGQGTLEIDHITLRSGGTDNFPIFQTTNTTVFIHHCTFSGNAANLGTTCQQDAVILGGTTTTSDGSATAAFQGYGSIIESNYFHKIRRGVHGRIYANSVVVRGNTFSSNCGSPDATAAAIDFLGSSTTSRNAGVVIRDNLIEQTNYPYGIQLDYCNSCIVEGNSSWDSSGVSLAAVHLGAHAFGNYILSGNNNNGSTPFVVEDSPGDNTIINTTMQQAAGAVGVQWAQAKHQFNKTATGIAMNNGSTISWASTQNGTADITLARNSGPKLTFTGASNTVFEFFGSEAHIGQAAAYAVVGSLGTSDAWLDAQGSNTNINTHVRAKGTGVVKFDSPVRFNTAGQLATTATAGAQTLPSNPVGFVVATDNNGTTIKIPYYAN